MFKRFYKNKRPIAVIFISVFLLCLAFTPLALEAQSQKVTFENPLSISGISGVPGAIGTVISTALGVVGSIGLLMIIIGGLMWLTAGGNAERVEKAKNILIWSAIGLVVIFTSYTIVSFVLGVLSQA